MIRALSAVSRGTEKNSSGYRVCTVPLGMRCPCLKLSTMVVFQGKQVARRDWLRWSAVLPFALAFAGCGSPRRQPSLPAQPEEPDAAQRVPDESPAPPRAQAVAIHAMGLVGIPYRYGGNTPDAGFDCSGLIGYVFHHAAGVRAPRTVVDISGWGTPVERADARSGDLAVFTLKGRTSHAGIYIGNGRFVHAPSTGGTVKLDRLDRGYWASQGLQFRRAV